MQIREMTENDISTVAQIENVVFKTPWSYKIFQSELSNSYSLKYVAICDGRVVGYSITWLLYDVAELQKICVIEEYRRRGIAQLLLNQNLKLARESGKPRFFLEVRESNVEATALYSKNGFSRVGLRKNYYGDESAVVMKKDLNIEDNNS